MQRLKKTKRPTTALRQSTTRHILAHFRGNPILRSTGARSRIVSRSALAGNGVRPVFSP
jgi:hypothetical protein